MSTRSRAAPASEKRRAVAAPIPAAAPVMRAVLRAREIRLLSGASAFCWATSHCRRLLLRAVRACPLAGPVAQSCLRGSVRSDAAPDLRVGRQQLQLELLEEQGGDDHHLVIGEVHPHAFVRAAAKADQAEAGLFVFFPARRIAQRLAPLRVLPQLRPYGGD